jgi:hypothetical protein
MKNVSDKSCRENRNKLFVFNFFNLAICKIIWKNIVERIRPQMTIWRMRCSCWIPNTTNTVIICTIYRICTATMVARTRLNVTLYVHCLYCWFHDTDKRWTREHFTETHYNIAVGLVIFQRSLYHCQRLSVRVNKSMYSFPAELSPACATTGSRHSAVHRHWCQVSS